MQQELRLHSNAKYQYISGGSPLPFYGGSPFFRDGENVTSSLLWPAKRQSKLACQSAMSWPTSRAEERGQDGWMREEIKAGHPYQ